MPDIDALYREHRSGLIRLANSYLRDTAAAEDVVQEVFARLLTDEIRDPEALSYLNTATVRRSLDAIRTQTRRRARHDRVGRRDFQEEPSAEDLALALDQSHRAEVADAIRGLSPQQRDALTLRYYGELTGPEIAEAMQISRGAVKSHTSRGRANLATALARPEPPPDPPPVRRPSPAPVRRTPPTPTVPVPAPTPPRNRGIGNNVDHRAEFGQPLTPVEVEILQRLATGAYDDAIARALEMSVRNMRRNLTAAQRKLGARTRPHAVALAITAGLIPIPREDTP